MLRPVLSLQERIIQYCVHLEFYTSLSAANCPHITPHVLAHYQQHTESDTDDTNFERAMPIQHKLHKRWGGCSLAGMK